MQRYLFGIFLVAISLTMFVSCESSTTGEAGASSTSTASAPKIDLLEAINQERTDIVQQHMTYGTGPNANPVQDGDLKGAYPLHLAAVKSPESIQILIDNGATLDLRATNNDQATPLHWAAFFLQVESVKTLIRAGAPINILDANDSTPLDAVNFMWLISESDNRRLAEPIISFIKDNGGKPATELGK
jgi:ankyrin repeat protein